MESMMEQFQDLKVEWDEIISATNNFDRNNLIGSGGFGKVYRGNLTDCNNEQSMVAFKRLDRRHGQGDSEFLKEITFLSRFKHQNLISLLGYCIKEKEMILVYEHASRGSLDIHLNSADLTWTQRLKICLAAAEGLNYLHNPRGTGQRLIHCDIKSANILLDEEWNAKVADFGLSKIGPANDFQNSMLVTNALGTMGYCDPLFMHTCSLTKESDVYSFGVVLFEVLCGRVCYQIISGQAEVLVPMWIERYKENKLEEIIFPELKRNMDKTCLEMFSEIAYRCLKFSRKKRPLMSAVVETLETALESQVKFQKLEELRLREVWKREVLGEYEEIVTAAVPPPTNYNSKEELKLLLCTGFLINGGRTWFTINHDEEHYEMISIAACLTPLEDEDDISRYSFHSNSRFENGCYSTNGKKFRAHVKTQFLSPLVTYNVNLVFKFAGGKEADRPGYLPLKYIFERDTKISMVYLVDKREDERLIAELYQFTSNGKTVDLKFSFEDHVYCNSLDIEGIEFQPLNNVVYHQPLELQYEQILKSIFPPLKYKSAEELKSLLNGMFFNESKMRISVNDNGQHSEMISIEPCLKCRYSYADTSFSSDYNSRFPVGSFDTRGEFFQTTARAQFLSPGNTYMVNLIFKCPLRVKGKAAGKQQFISLTYELNKKEKKIWIGYLADMSEDEWLVAGLYQFTTGINQSSVEVDIVFESHHDYLVVDGFEFQPMEINNGEVENNDDELVVLDDKYQEIVKSAEPLLKYKSVQELELLLSKGVIVNGGNTWFYLDDDGQHCELISIKNCLIRVATKWNHFFGKYVYDDDHLHYYHTNYNSRFLDGSYRAGMCNFKIRARAQFLTPSITYSVNLVFKIDYETVKLPKQPYIRLKYTLEGHTETSISFLADMREDEWWMVELCHFTSEQGTTTADLQIIFQGSDSWIIAEGIEFLPVEELEKVQHHVVEETHPILLDIDPYWEQKVRNDYEEIIKLSKESVQWTTKKELYLVFSKGFLINNGQEWLSLDKNGKTCLLLSPRAACVEDENWKWQSLPETRFGETLELSYLEIQIVRRIKYQVLASETTYATYLIYKLPEDQSAFEVPVEVKDGDATWYVYLVSPQIPVINVREKVIDRKTYNPLFNRPKIKGIPQHRNDGWMEVQVWEFQTAATTNMIPMHIRLEGYNKLPGIFIQGIEFRPT